MERPEEKLFLLAFAYWENSTREIAVAPNVLY
jgi:hypothetical protein